MSSKTLIKIIITLVFGVVVLVPLFYFKQGIYPFLFDKSLFFQALVEILFGLWIVLAAHSPEYRPRFTPLIKALAVFIGALIITAFLGLDPWRSFFSTYERAYGVFGIMHIAAFAFVLSSLWKKLPWKWIFASSIAVSALTAIIAILELYYDNNLLLNQPGGRSGATFGNPTFLAGYLTWNIFLALYFFLRQRGSSGAVVGGVEFGWRKSLSKFLFSRAYLIPVVILEIFTIIFVTQTRGNILGLIFGFFTLLALFAIHPSSPEKKIGVFSLRLVCAIFVAVLIVSGTIFWFTRTNSFWSKIPGVNRFQEVSLEAESLQPRLIALRAAWKGFLENPIFGVGPENFNIVFNKYYDPKALRLNYQETRFDKPHNVIAEDLVTGGIVLALAHLIFFGIFIFRSLKLQDKLFGQVSVAALAGYFVGNLFIFSTIGPDLLLFIFVGFLAGPWGGSEISGESRPSTNFRNNLYGSRDKVPSIPLVVALIISFVFAYLVNINTMRASNSLFHGFFDLAGGKVEEGVGGFRKTLSIWSPWRWNFARDFAAAMSEFYFYNPEIAKKEDVLEAISWMEYARDKHPLDAYNHYALVDMYNEISDIDPEKFLAAAEREAAIALSLSPDRQQVYFSLAKTKTLQGDYPAAIELAKQGLSLDDKVADGHFYYGLLLLAHGETDLGDAELKTAIRLGRKWKNFYEPLTVGNLLADAGRIEDAIELYAISVVMSDGQNQLEPKTKLGVAFYFAGKLKEAKEELQYVADKFDFRTSSSFAEMKPILDDLGIVY